MFYKKKVAKHFFAFFLLAFFCLNIFAFPSLVSASDVFGTGAVEDQINLSSTDPRTTATRIINIALGFLGIVAVGIVIYGGFIWMSSEGNEEKVIKAKSILKAGVIGLAIILSAWGITTFIFNKLGDATGIAGVFCEDADIKPCGRGGLSTCIDNKWGPCVGSTCVGSNCLPGDNGSWCSSGLSNTCQPDDSQCNNGLICGPSCLCVYEGEGDPCGEVVENICNNEVPPVCPEPLNCSPSTCTCIAPGGDENISELGGPCGGEDDEGASCENDKTCNLAHGLSCENCKCVGNPVITGISPLGGFCQNDINKPCLQDEECLSGVCDKTSPNAAPGNFVTITGYNFNDEYNEFLSGVNFIRESDNLSVPGKMPSSVNSHCGNTWSNNQIIVVFPEVFSESGSDVSVEVVTKENKKDNSNDEIGPKVGLIKVNNIKRPGLCGINPGEAKMNQDIRYYGINLSDSKVYFGNYNTNVSGFNPNTFNSDFSGEMIIPNLKEGNTSTFAKKLGTNVPSNFLDFKKLPEPPKGPSISFFEPSIGSEGQYISIYGSGFESSQGFSQVYFSPENGEDISASFKFPPVCLHSVWRNDQIIIKVPDNIDYDKSPYQIKIKIGNWDEILSSDFFIASSTALLSPSLCKISPSSGPEKTTIVNFWGEYFSDSEKDTKTVFNTNKISGPLTVASEGGAEKVASVVPEGVSTGPVKVLRGVLFGNSLNFNVSSCTKEADCPGQVCCGPKTANPGSCVDSVIECSLEGSPKSSVFEWGFDTSFTGSGEEDDDPNSALSCASYNFCPSNYACPNSPGFCSPYDGLRDINLGPCTNDCSSFSDCGPNGERCSYLGYNTEGKLIDKCVLDSSCSKSVVYSLGGEVDKEIKSLAICKEHNLPGLGKRFFYTLNIKTTCPNIDGVQWSKTPNGSCVDASLVSSTSTADVVSTCSLCPENFACSSEGQCISNKICPAGSECTDNQCIKKPSPSCQCCCDKDQNDLSGNPSCCAPLTCEYSCGDSANLEPATELNYGLCSGCAIYYPENSTNISLPLSDAACNCFGTSGKYCEVSEQYKEGACLDCTALGKEACRSHNSTCCWDDNDEGVCRGGASDSSIWGDNISNIGFCPYYSCGTGDDSTVCLEDNPMIVGEYKDQPSCVDGCPKNCGKIESSGACIDNSDCCWDDYTAKCTNGERFEEDSSFPGYCKRYNCSDYSGECNTEAVQNGQYLKLNTCIKVCKDTPSDFGMTCSNKDDMNICLDTCNKLSCLTEDGVMGTAPSCGTCCCDPTAAEDQCSAINDKLACYKNIDTCSGNDRGLCCGCESDEDCVSGDLDPEKVGCGMDSCCKARPKIENTFPKNKEGDVCHNALIVVDFDQKMDNISFSENVLLLEESFSTCSSGTYFISQRQGFTVFDKVRNVFEKTSNYLSRIINKNVFAAGPDSSRITSKDKVYCSVLGSVDSRQNANDTTSLTFSPNKLLKEGVKYFFVIKGDENLDGGSGVLSAQSIGMNGKGYEISEIESVEGESYKLSFNNLNFKNSHLFSFETMKAPADEGGVCSVDQVLISPESYLFSSNTNDLQENDDDPDHKSFDSISDHDKAYYSYALSTDGQFLKPVSGYSWEWEWNIIDSKVVNFKDVISWGQNSNKKLVAVNNNITDSQTSLVATVRMDSSNSVIEGDGTYGSVPVYVFVCRNPWPAVVNGEWSPWRDSGTSFGNYNYEFYYCRDAGSDATSDDLPAFLSNNAVVKGESPINVCSNLPSKICSSSGECPSGGFCISSFLKEAYFFKERIPKFVENVLVSDPGTGGSLNLSWSSDSGLVDKYKIYYRAKGEKVYSEELVSVSSSYCESDNNTNDCSFELLNLSNNISYEVKITALSDNLAETGFSSTVLGTPTDSNVPNIPLNPKVEVLSQEDREIKISWDAPANYEVKNYKIYRGSEPDVHGTSFLTSDNLTDIVFSLNNTQGDIFYFAISSINPKGTESAKSFEVSLSFSRPDFVHF